MQHVARVCSLCDKSKEDRDTQLFVPHFCLLPSLANDKKQKQAGWCLTLELLESEDDIEKWPDITYECQNKNKRTLTESEFHSKNRASKCMFELDLFN